jgi:hypothetical protein
VEEVRKLYWMWHMDRRSRAPIQRKLWLWRRGFTVLSGELYGLPRRDLQDFLPDFHATHLIKPINSSLAFYRHKVAQRALLLAAGIPQTPTIAALWKGRVVLHPFSDRAEPIDPAGLTAWLLADGGSFIVKPEDGGRGAATYLLAPEDRALVVRRGSQRTAFRCEDFMDRLTLIERRIEQAAAWRALFPETLNTIRALTLWPRNGDGPFLARAIQRIGAPETIPCDNFAAAGSPPRSTSRPDGWASADASGRVRRGSPITPRPGRRSRGWSSRSGTRSWRRHCVPRAACR